MSLVQGVELLREVTAVDPLEYDQQQKDDAAGIRNVSAFVQELAERCEQMKYLSSVGEATQQFKGSWRLTVTCNYILKF